MNSFIGDKSKRKFGEWPSVGVQGKMGLFAFSAHFVASAQTHQNQSEETC